MKNDNKREVVSILDDIDFELELIRRDKINVSYIITLLRNMKTAKPTEQEKQRNKLLLALESETQLRSKKELIQRFIARHFSEIPNEEGVGYAFNNYWNMEKEKAIRT